MLIQALNDLQRLQGIAPQTTNFKADYTADFVLLDILDEVLYFAALLNGFSTANLVAEGSLNAPTDTAAIFRQFVYLPLILLLVSAHPCQNHNLVHLAKFCLFNYQKPSMSFC